ncbi:GNAT family N-acetyltransferase [Ancylobacter lacus]|uniref:GNAT family N-acetyltransferase n=1 Tax=Ancylobacter lacus TaxID=2579970 RepID=UPI001BCCE8CF|nr:GNAT family N-acetyltransferase [Ancylobacter lacus]MBS7537881.1 GNAT family N-acetyltransferase [Ancylobacter lacus]
MPAAASSLATSRATRHHAEAVLPGYFRELTAGEFDQYGEHLLRLDPHSRFTRFGGPASDEVVKAHVERLRGSDLHLVGYFVDGVLRGVGELHGLPGVADSAEAAFSVERAWQGKGVGSALMDRIVKLAEQRGIVDLTIMFLAINGRMQRIVVNHFGELTRAEDEMIGHVRPPRRQSPMSWVRQLVTASLAVVDGAIDLQARMLPPSHRGW